MPNPSASLGERGLISTPSSRTVPPSRGKTPVSTLINVLLPAPFSPIRAWTSPRRTVKSTRCNAFTPGKDLDRPRTSSNAGVSPVFDWVCVCGEVMDSLRRLILPIGQLGGGLGLFEHSLLHNRAFGERL